MSPRTKKKKKKSVPDPDNFHWMCSECSESEELKVETILHCRSHKPMEPAVRLSRVNTFRAKKVGARCVIRGTAARLRRQDRYLRYPSPPLSQPRGRLEGREGGRDNSFIGAREWLKNITCFFIRVYLFFPRIVIKSTPSAPNRKQDAVVSNGTKPESSRS